MLKRELSFLAILFCLFAGLFGMPNQADAQLPSSVDIGLYEVTPGLLEVRMKANGNSFDEVVSGIVFTIKWETASGATLGTVNQQIGAAGAGWCPLVVASVAASPGGVLSDGGFQYSNYNVIGTSQINSCAFSPGYSWPAGTEIVLCEIPYTNATGCTNFEIATDAFTASQNFDYFISLNGIDVTGARNPSTVSVNCSAECIRFNSVNPTTNDIVIENFGATTVDVSSYRLCALFGYTANLTSVLTSGSLILAPGATATLNWPLDATASDLGLYTSAVFSDPAAMLDFTQWGSGGNGRESVAVIKGIWSSGDFVDDTTPWNAPFTYTGSGCTNNGVSFWTGADCEGTQGGSALPTTTCDDGDATTGNDVYDANCNCAGQLIDCEGTAGGTALPGTTCDDGDATTGNDVYDANCNCAGQLIDCEGTAGGTALPGTTCDDGDATTGNDVYDANCNCAGQLIDCEGTIGGTALPGTACDDGDPNTNGDVYDANCNCAGLTVDCEGTPGGTALPGTTCDDGDATTGNDVYDANCNCAGQLIDCEGTIGGTALPGTTCDDGDPNTTGDVYDANCNCAGLAVDCEGTPGGTALPGTACDDGDATTGNDVYDANCNCAGQLIDCEGTIGGTALPGTTCDDGDATTGNDVYDANCNCAGQLIDCEGTAGGTALPGTTCDDGDPNTTGDVYDANCNCAGLAVDCEGTPGGTALPGTACDDGDATTGNDVYQGDCTCVGQLIDCEGTIGGSALPGTSCDDGDPNTSNDVYDANCNCAGTAALDCEGVPGGTALPGTACDDGDATTGNDVYDANCICAGQLIDCEGTVGGTALPGTPCDDGDPNTVGDAYDANCNCAGSTTCPGTEVTLEVETDDNGNETTWEILPAGGSTAVCSGGPYASNTTFSETCCLPNGCYELRVYDSMGDGMFTGAAGGYKLFVTGGGASRIIDNTKDGQFGSLSAIANNNAFCVPLGNDRLAHYSCDRYNYDVNDFVIVASNPAVAAEYGVGAQNDDGFQYWIFNPDGGFSRFIFLSHANPSNGAPPGAYAVNHLNLASLNSVQAVPQNIRLNIRVRSRVNGVNSAFGPACVMMVDPVAANDPCPTTTLHFDPNHQYFSCNVTRTWGGSDYVTAFPVLGANKYQFEYSDGAGFVRRIAYPSYHSFLSWGTLPLIVGTTYDVRVRISKDQGANWCPWGGTCTVSIVAPPLAAVNKGLFNEGAEFTVYPNPNRGEALFLNLAGLSSEDGTATISITDMYGKQVHQEQITISGGSYSNALSVEKELAQGMYLVNLQVGGTSYTQRLVRQ